MGRVVSGGWSDEESTILRRVAAEGRADDQIAEALGRSVQAVTALRLLLGIELRSGRGGQAA